MKATHRLSWVLYFTDAKIFQGNNTSWFLILLVKKLTNRKIITYPTLLNKYFKFY